MKVIFLDNDGVICSPIIGVVGIQSKKRFILKAIHDH
jgi:histidinol phosphatase-like enzyme